MPGQVLNITNGTITPTPVTPPDTAQQPGREATDVSSAPGNRFDFSARCLFLNGTSVDVTLETSMYNDDNFANWEPLVTFTTLTASNTVDVQSVNSGVLRYVRWRVGFTSVTTVTLEILGMAW